MKIVWGYLVLFVLACNLVGSIGALWTGSDSPWYKSLEKPKFNPPSWVFSPVWIFLFSLMGIALYFVFFSVDSKIKMIALILFGIQFLFNIFWSYLFFGIGNVFLAFIEILILLSLIIVTIFYFFRVNIFAGYLLIPYGIWVAFASFLNYSIWRLNV